MPSAKKKKNPEGIVMLSHSSVYTSTEHLNKKADKKQCCVFLATEVLSFSIYENL